MSLEEKFWVRVSKTDGCWLWNKYKNEAGYGQFQYRENGTKRNYYAHRFIFFFLNPNIDQTLCVCHQCDNPGCVRPDHLFAGTQKENMMDKVRKGRQFKGKRKPIANMPF